MSKPIRGRGGHFVFPIHLNNTNLVEGVEILLPVKFRWIPFSGFRWEVENVSANQRPGRPSCLFDQLEKHKLGKGHWDLASCQVSLNSVQRFQRRSKNVSAIRGRSCHFVFPIGSKNTNLVEGIEILLPVKFRWIPFSGFRGEVENVSANQRPGRPSCFFSDRPEKHKLGRGRAILLSVKFPWIPFSGLRGEVENVSANQGLGRPFCFPDRPEKSDKIPFWVVLKVRRQSQPYIFQWKLRDETYFMINFNEYERFIWKMIRINIKILKL